MKYLVTYRYEKTSWIPFKNKISKLNFIELEISNSNNLNSTDIYKLCFDYLQHSLPFKPKRLKIYSIIKIKL